jgi:hypothetical protein
MLSADRDASLGPDVAPKLQALFATVKRDVTALAELALAPLRVKEGETTWVLRLERPEVERLVAITAQVALSGRERFAPVTLAAEGDAWVGALTVDEDEPEGELRYFLVAELRSGAQVFAGSEEAPKSAPVRFAAGSTPPVGDTEPSPFDGPTLGTGDGDGAGLPPWALWTIVGGGAALVAIGVTLAVVLSGNDEPGAVKVNIVFED